MAYTGAITVERVPNFPAARLIGKLHTQPDKNIERNRSHPVDEKLRRIVLNT